MDTVWFFLEAQPVFSPEAHARGLNHRATRCRPRTSVSSPRTRPFCETIDGINVVHVSITDHGAAGEVRACTDKLGAPRQLALPGNLVDSLV